MHKTIHYTTLPYISLMWKDNYVGWGCTYTELFHAILPTLFPCICYLYISLPFQHVLVLLMSPLCGVGLS